MVILGEKMRNLKVALFLAFKSITKGHKSTTALMIFVLSLSFVNMIFIASILNGFGDAFISQLRNNITSNMVIDPQEKPKKEEFIPDAQELQEKIKKIRGVIGTTKHYKMVGTISYNSGKDTKPKGVSGQILGVDPAQEKRLILIYQKMIEGQYLDEQQSGQVVLGADLAGGYGTTPSEFTSLGGVKAGDKVKVMFSNGAVREYTVKGVFKTRLGFADRLAFISTEDAESVLGVHDKASQILVKTDLDQMSENDYQKKVQEVAPALTVRTWADVVGDYGKIFESLDLITLIVSGIALAVAAITIFILIYINAINNRRQIGILKAIGIKQSIIIKSYVVQAVFYALSGIIIGSIFIFYVIAPYFVAHPLSVGVADISLALDKRLITYGVISLFAAALIAGLIPSWQVIRQNILKAIWGA